MKILARFLEGELNAPRSDHFEHHDLDHGEEEDGKEECDGITLELHKRTVCVSRYAMRVPSMWRRCKKVSGHQASSQTTLESCLRVICSRSQHQQNYSSQSRRARASLSEVRRLPV